MENPISPFAFIKIHKCGSTTGRFWMEQIAKKANYSLFEPKKSRYFLRSSDIRNKEEGWDTSASPYSALTRHCAYDPNFFASYMVLDLKFYSLIRDPLARSLSCLYSHDVNKSVNFGQSIQEFYSKNIDFITKKPSEKDNISRHVPVVLKANFMAYMLGFNSLEEISKESLERRYNWIGVLERIDESFSLLEKEVGLRLKKDRTALQRQKYPERKNNNLAYDSIKNLTLDGHFIEHFKEVNSLDYKIYDIVNRSIDAALGITTLG